jgi:hypothetical protein
MAPLPRPRHTAAEFNSTTSGAFPCLNPSLSLSSLRTSIVRKSLLLPLQLPHSNTGTLPPVPHDESPSQTETQKALGYAANRDIQTSRALRIGPLCEALRLVVQYKGNAGRESGVTIAGFDFFLFWWLHGDLWGCRTDVRIGGTVLLWRTWRHW